MQRSCLVVLVSLFVSAFAACGDDSPNKPEDAFRPYLDRPAGDGMPVFPSGMPPGLPGGASSADAMGLVTDMGKVELTDEMMANYLEVMKKLKAIDGEKPDEALLAAHSLEWRHWVFISSTIARAHMAVNMPEQIETAEKALARARQQAEQATDERMKKAFEAQAKGFEAQLKSLKSMPGPTELDRKNFAVFERWRERLEEAGK